MSKKKSPEDIIKKVNKRPSSKPKKEKPAEVGSLFTESCRMQVVSKEVEGKLTDVLEVVQAGGRRWLTAQGDTEAKVLVVLDSPKPSMLGDYGVVDYVGDAAPDFKGADLGRELRLALEAGGFDVEKDVFITCAQKFIAGNTKVHKLEKAKCREFLVGELQEVKPKLVIALGAEAFKAVMNKNVAIGAFMGQCIELPEFNTRVFATHSPVAVGIADPTLRPEWHEHMMLASKYVDGEPVWDPIDYLLVEDVQTAKFVVDHYLTTIVNDLFYVGYDAEWKGPKWYEGEVMYTFQFSVEDHKAVVLKLTNDGKTENRELLDTIKPLIEHPNARRCGWNIRADDKRLVHRGFKLPDETLFFDGMKACGFFDSRWGKGLETGVMKFTNYGPYYTALNVALKKHKLDYSEMCDLMFLEPEIFFNYSAGDAASHRMACINMSKQFPAHLRELYDDVYLPLGQFLLDMEQVGCPMDIPVMEKMTEMYNAKFNELIERLRIKLKAPDINMPEFNPNSQGDKKKLLFEVLKMQPAFYTYKKKARPKAWYDKQKKDTQALCNPSTNNSSIMTMLFQARRKWEGKAMPEHIVRHLDVLENLVALNRVNVFANKFLSKRGIELTEEDLERVVDEAGEEMEGDEPLKQSYWSALDKFGHAHADFFECLDNFRCSSSPNLQNPPGKASGPLAEIFVPGYGKMTDEEKAKNQHLIPANLRNAFSSDMSRHPLAPTGTNKDDWVFIEADVAGADLAISSFLSNDPKFKEDMLSGGFHERRMQAYFNDPNLTKKDVSKYTIGKTITFRLSYSEPMDAAAEPIQAQLFAENGLLVPLEEIKYAIKTWEQYGPYMQTRKMTVEEALNTGQYQTPYGPVNIFSDSKDQSHRASYANRSLALGPASTLAWAMHTLGVDLRKYCKSWGVWMTKVFPTLYVHDAIYLAVHKSLVADCPESGWPGITQVVSHFFSHNKPIPTGDYLGVGVDLTDVWKGKKYWAAETAFNFEEGRWGYSSKDEGKLKAFMEECRAKYGSFGKPE